MLLADAFFAPIAMGHMFAAAAHIMACCMRFLLLFQLHVCVVVFTHLFIGLNSSGANQCQYATAGFCIIYGVLRMRVDAAHIPHGCQRCQSLQICECLYLHHIC